MQAEIAHAAVNAVHAVFALPVDRLVGVEVACVIESRLDFNDLTELATLGPLDHLLAGGKERELTGTAAEDLGVIFECFQNGVVLRLVHAKRLFPHQMLPGIDDVTVDLLMQDVRDGAVDRLNILAGQQIAIVREVIFEVREGFVKPLEGRGIPVTDADDLRLCDLVLQMDPAKRRAGKFPPHQAAADDTKFHCFHMLSPLISCSA